MKTNLNVVFDLKAILAVDPAGIQSLLDAHQLFTQCGQRMVLGEPSPRVRGLLEAAGLERAIPIFASVAEALASFRSPAVTLPKSRFATAQPSTTSPAK